MLAHEPVERFGELDGIEIFALDVFDQCELEGVFRRDVAHDDQHLAESRTLGRAPAPLTGDDLELAVAASSHDERLE